MKNNLKYSLLVVLIGITLFSFTESITSLDYEVLTAKSEVKWTGRKPGGEHTGTVDLKSGSFSIENDIITSGSFVLDMTSIKVTDSESQKLLNHIKSEDFFNVQKYTESKLVITSGKSTAVDDKGKHTLELTGNLTILDKTLPITFTAKNTAKTENFMVYSSSITIDRTKYGITYKSSLLGDAMINDEFDMDIKLFAKKK